MKQKPSKKVIKKQNPYKVSKEFMRCVEEFNREHEDVLRELAKR